MSYSLFSKGVRSRDSMGWRPIEKPPLTGSLVASSLVVGSLLVKFLMVGLLLSGFLGPTGSVGAEPKALGAAIPIQGLSLSKALRVLQSEGLAVVFSSTLVPPQGRVEVEPQATDLAGILQEILAPHGLTSQATESGIWVVVRGGEASPTGSSGIYGTVVSRSNRGPLVAVTLIAQPQEGGESSPLPAGGFETLSDAEGRFELSVPGGSVYRLEARIPGYVVEQLEQVAVAADRPTEVLLELNPAPITREEMIVTPSQIALLAESSKASLALSKEEIKALPHLGDDVFRALSLLPGTSSNDRSAQFQVRGGRRDEVQVLLDGQELFDAFHLKEFDNAISIVGSEALGRVDLTTGGFPAKFGDRMSGVLDMTTAPPPPGIRTHFGVSLLTFELGNAGTSRDGKGAWLGLARRGFAELAEKIVDRQSPNYWDAYGKFEYRLSPRNLLRANLLHSGDVFELTEAEDGEFKDFDTEYDNTYAWLSHQITAGSRLLVETTVSRSRLERDRIAIESEEEQSWDLRDSRKVDVDEVRQAWDFQASSHHYLEWGVGFRRFEAAYDVDVEFDFQVPLAELRDGSRVGAITFLDAFSEEHTSAYLVDRIQPFEGLTLELGVRYDRQTLTDEDHVSPRINLAYSLGERTLARAAWGYFYQSQRPYELEVVDGETSFNRAERSEHRSLGIEHLFRKPVAGGRQVVLRLEAYQREIADPRPRWENLFEGFNNFPELEPDRVRITPEETSSEGIELFLRTYGGKRWDGWLNFAYSSVRDRIAGASVPRQIDQPRALNANLSLHLSPVWDLDLAWRYRSGWPTTRFTVIQTAGEGDDDGEGDEGGDDGEGDEGETDLEFHPVLGPLFGDRLSDYHRLDLRASRTWKRPWGNLVFFVDVQNAYNRRNLAGFDYEIDEDDGTILADPDHWLSITPSAGFRWEF